jgi:hypothetical protein
MRFSVLVIGAMIACHIPTAHAQETNGPYRAGSLRDACYTFTQGSTTTGVLLPKEPALGRSPQLCGLAAK